MGVPDYIVLVDVDTQTNAEVAKASSGDCGGSRGYRLRGSGEAGWVKFIVNNIF